MFVSNIDLEVSDYPTKSLSVEYKVITKIIEAINISAQSNLYVEIRFLVFEQDKYHI